MQDIFRNSCKNSSLVLPVLPLLCLPTTDQLFILILPVLPLFCSSQPLPEYIYSCSNNPFNTPVHTISAPTPILLVNGSG
ncbi:hypothetical protein GYMLUDRAFT_46697 [Collybiopsis luxurians FD-317 M1]|uniref:Unplaced genomic scaffold GYMLUscaffold_45, whole genome shotgun sequence n=1 Tax=Collybiopsis luxurians FD-317 M1 TaxID=944289 RepID=A0A0D0CG27_9AGAR|nr:hypothetical protein GYMLUDRAFT_46697 [Collybiopsis luxurians FD-317 M1]